MERKGVNNAPEGLRPAEAPNSGVRRNVLNIIKGARERMGQGAEKFRNAITSLKNIAAVQGGTRKRMHALAMAGAALSFEQLEKKDLMADVVSGVFEPAENVNEQPQYAVSLLNNDYHYRVINADGLSDSMMRWIAVRKNGVPFILSYAENAGSDVPTVMIFPDEVNLDEIFIRGDLPERLDYEYNFEVMSQEGQQPGGLEDFVEGATVYAGFGSLSQTPQTIEEAIAMTDGVVVTGNYPSSGIGITDEWVLHYSQSLPQLQGDFNNNGSVDAADYVLWRKTNSSDQQAFETWRSNFGNTIAGAGAGSQVVQENNGGVPESSTLALAGIGTGVYLLTRRTREAGKVS